VLIVIAPTANRDDTRESLEVMFGAIAAMRFLDGDGDWIEIDSSDAWEYCTRVGAAMATAGNFPLLVLDTQ
jgi:hypothetical protein